MSAASNQVTAPAVAASAFKSEGSQLQLPCNISSGTQNENERRLSKKTRIELLGATNDHNYNLPRRRDEQQDCAEPMLKRMAAATAGVAGPAAAVASEQLAFEAIAANNGGDGTGGNPGGHMDDCMAAMVLMFLSCRPGGEELGVDGQAAAFALGAADRAKAAAVAAPAELAAQVAKASGSTQNNADALSRREPSAKVGAKRNSEPIEMDTSSQKKLYQRHSKRRPFSDDSLCEGAIVAGHEHGAAVARGPTAGDCGRRPRGRRPGLREQDGDDDDDDALDDGRPIELAFAESKPPEVEDEMIFELQQVDQIDEPARPAGCSLETAMDASLLPAACSQPRGNKAPSAAPPRASTEMSQREASVAVGVDGGRSVGDKESFQPPAAVTTTETSPEQPASAANNDNSPAEKTDLRETSQDEDSSSSSSSNNNNNNNNSNNNSSSSSSNNNNNNSNNNSSSSNNNNNNSNSNSNSNSNGNGNGNGNGSGNSSNSNKPAAPTLVSQQQQQVQSAAATVNFCNGKQQQQQLRQQLRFRMNNPVKTRTIFSCMWPGCTKNYDALEDIERHVRSHLGPKQCDAFGDEDFYYEETEVDEATYLAIFSRTSTLPLSPSHNSDGLSSGQSFASSSPATSPVCSSGDSSSSSACSASSAASSAASSSSYPSNQLYANSIDWNHFLADHNQLLRASGASAAGVSGKWLPAASATGGSSSSAAVAAGKQTQLAALTSGQHQQQLQVYHNHSQQLQPGPTAVAQVGAAPVGGLHRFGSSNGGRHSGSPLAAPDSPLYNHHHHNHHHSHSHLALNGAGSAARAPYHRKLEPAGHSSNRNHHHHQLSQHQQRQQRLAAMSSLSPAQQAGSGGLASSLGGHQQQMDSLRLVAAAAGLPDSMAASSSALQFSMQLSGGSPVPSSSPSVGGARPSGALYQRRSPNNHQPSSNSNQNHQKSAPSSSDAAAAAAAALSLSTRHQHQHQHQQHQQHQPAALERRSSPTGYTGSSAGGAARVGAKRGRKPKHLLLQQQAEQAAGYHLGLLMQQQATQTTTSGQAMTQLHASHLKHNLSQQFFQNPSTSSQQLVSSRQQSNQSNRSSSGNNNSGSSAGAGGRGLVAAAVASLRAAQVAAAASQSSLAAPSPSSLGVVRRTRGENRKCRKVYGMERRDLWCTQCKWKKACSRFCDP